MSVDKSKELDQLVRGRLESEVVKSKELLKNIVGVALERKDSKTTKSSQKLSEDLDLLVNELMTAPVGHKYPRGAPMKSSSAADVQKVVRFDASFVTEFQSITEALNQIDVALADDGERDVNKDLAGVHRQITRVRNMYRDRVEYQKGLR